MFIDVKYKTALKIKIVPVVIMKEVSVADLFSKILDVPLQFSWSFQQILAKH